MNFKTSMSRVLLVAVLRAAMKMCLVSKYFLGGLRLCNRDGLLHILATNGTDFLHIETNQACEGESIDIPIRSLFDLLNAIDVESVTITQIFEQSFCTVRHGNNSTELSLQLHTTWPTEHETTKRYAILPTPELLRVLQLADDITLDALMNMDGLLFEGNCDNEFGSGQGFEFLRLVTTDGHRMALVDIESGVRCYSSEKLILSPKSIRALLSMSTIWKKGSIVEVESDDDFQSITVSVLCKDYKVRVSSKTGHIYPHYPLVIGYKRGDYFSVKTSATELKKLATLAVALNKKEHVQVLFEQPIDAPGVSVTYRLENQNPQKYELPTLSTAKVGRVEPVAVNAKYLLDAANHLGKHQVTMRFTGKLGPVLIRTLQSLGTNADQTMFVIMPIRL